MSDEPTSHVTTREDLLAELFWLANDFAASLTRSRPDERQLTSLSRLARVAGVSIQDLIKDAVLRDPPPDKALLPRKCRSPEDFQRGLLALLGLTNEFEALSPRGRFDLAAPLVGFKHGAAYRNTRSEGQPVAKKHLAWIADRLLANTPEIGPTTATEERAEQTEERSPDRSRRLIRAIGSRRLRRRAIASVVLAAVVASAATALVITQSGTGRPAAIDAETGKPIPQPAISNTGHARALIEGGQLLSVCAKERSWRCMSYADMPITLHVGELIRVEITLINPGPDVLPVFRAAVSLMPARHSFTLTAQIAWNGGLNVCPPKATTNCRMATASEPMVFKVNEGSFPNLLYVKHSSRLAIFNGPVVRLPDGVASPPGLLFADLGVPPAACFDCTNAFFRTIEYEARVIDLN